jgi:hypothetical protein
MGRFDEHQAENKNFGFKTEPVSPHSRIACIFPDGYIAGSRDSRAVAFLSRSGQICFQTNSLPFHSSCIQRRNSPASSMSESEIDKDEEIDEND